LIGDFEMYVAFLPSVGLNLFLTGQSETFLNFPIAWCALSPDGGVRFPPTHPFSDVLKNSCVSWDMLM